MTNPQHVILLKKNLKPVIELDDSWIPSPNSHWMALGHFDDIYLYSIESDNFFTSISENKTSISVHNNGSAFFHPLYLVPAETEIEANANNDHIFIAIVRIHLAKPTDLKNQFQNLQSKIKSIFISPDFLCNMYYATEFSDMVLEIFSDNFESLLKRVLSLRKNTEIGKTYTYFGINMNFLRSENVLPESNDTVPYLSIRFSGQNLPVIFSQINLIRQKLGRKAEYCITGIDDILMYYTQLPTEDLITLYRELLFNETYVNVRKSESTTRIGIEGIEHSFNFNPTAPIDYEPHPLCADLLSLKDHIYNWIVSTDSQALFGWFHAISETANSLVRMSRSPVMDELVYLLAPGVNAFLSNVKREIATPNSSLSLSTKTCYEYVESCTYFLEQLIRIEGQLSHNPEIRPVIYDIPVFMLEYTLAFLNKISLLLQHSDSSSQELHYVFLLVPRPCDHITAKELFPAQNGEDGLVQITIPEKILYNASEILRALCHEISHYVGENNRNREKRKTYYARAAASLANRCILQSNKQAAIHVLESLFTSELNQQEEPTIQQMHSVIADKIDTIFLDEQAFFDFKARCFNITTSYPLPNLPQNDILYYLDIFHERFNDLDILFREVYADICMLYILSVSPKEYIESLISELIAHPQKNSTYKDAFAIRIYVALKSTGNDIRLDEIDKCSRCYTLWASLYETIKNISDAIENGTTGQFKLSLPISSVFALFEYASACYSSITNSLKNHSNEIKEIQKMFNEFSGENFDYISFLEKIDEYRLTRWSQTNT